MPPPYYRQPSPSPLPRPSPPVSPTGTQHPLAGDPRWPSVPMPGPDSGTTVSPFMVAWRVLGVGDAAAGGQGLLEQAKMMRRLKHAYPDVPIGNYPYPGQGFPGAGPPPGWDPNVPQTTVGQITNPLGQAGKLSTPVLTAYEQARFMENLQRGWSNLNLPNIPLPGGFGTIRPGGMAPPPPGSPSATPPPGFGVTPGMPQQGYPPPPPWSPGQPDPSHPGPPTQWPTWLQPPPPRPGDLPPP